jgi:hypothetical protein
VYNFDPLKRKRFERNFFHFTRLEEHFLKVLKRILYVVNSSEGDNLRITVLFRRRNSPYIEMSASLNHMVQPITLQVHGIKPVRYHVQTSNTVLGRKLRRYFSQALGEENLHLGASNQTGPLLSLVYHVYYSEDVLRQLGC